MISKPSRETNEKYLVFIREQRCLISNQCIGEVDAHHTKSRGSGGSDYSAVPLCRKHHTQYHTKGGVWFSKNYEIQMYQEIARLLQQWAS